VAVLHIFKSCHKIWSTLDPELHDCWADTFAVQCLSSYKSVWTQNIKCNACMSAFDTLPLSFVQIHLAVCSHPVPHISSEWQSYTFLVKDCYWHKQLLFNFTHSHFWMRVANEWCWRVKCMCLPLHVYAHLMEEFTHMCHMLSNMHSISCISTFFAPKIFAMIEGVAFLVSLKQYGAACNCSWIVTSLNLLLINAFFSLWIREMWHGKFRTTYMPVARNSSTGREDWAGQLPWHTPAYKASFHGTFSPCFFP